MRHVGGVLSATTRLMRLVSGLLSEKSRVLSLVSGVPGDEAPRVFAGPGASLTVWTGSLAYRSGCPLYFNLSSSGTQTGFLVDTVRAPSDEDLRP